MAVKNRLYDDVVVNSVKLQIAEMRALASKNAASSLLNKVVDLIFTEEELVSTKGVKSLDQHKISAIKGNYQPKHLFDIMSSNLDQGEVYNIMW